MAAPIPPGTYIDQGRDWFMTVIWKDPDGVPINITGHSATFDIRENYEGPVLISLTSTAGQITLGGVTGEYDIHLPNAINDLVEGNYVAELVDTFSGVETSLLKGNLPVRAKVVP